MGIPLKAKSIYLESEDKLRLFTNSLPIAIYITDIKGVITYYNEAAASLWGHRPQLNDPTEARFCGAYKLYDSEGKFLPHDKCPLAQVLQSREKVRNEELTVVRPDDSKVTVTLHVDPVYDIQNIFLGAISVMLDVSEQKKIQHDVYHLAAIVESSDDAIVSKTPKGEITSWNKGAERIFGYSQEEVIGKHISIIIPEERLNEETVIISKILRGEKIDHFETVRRRKDGTYIYVSLTISPIKNSKGVVIGASKIARDITGQVEMTRKLKQYNNELRRLNRYKDEFISLASHELKTPLTVIKAYLELLKENYTGNDPSTVEKPLIHAEKLEYLINEMLDVTKVQVNKLELDKSEFLFQELLDESIHDVAVINPGASINVQFEEAGVVVFADRQRIGQVLINLFSNAIKYSSVHSDVNVKVYPSEGFLNVDVKDHGLGIPRDKFEEVFKRFYRMEGAHHHISGLGIGLFICKKIIEKHGGKIWVKDSELNKGTTFSFTLPIEGKK